MANDESKLTPMLLQYKAIRDNLPQDTVLFYRLGDFYELFFDDAKRAAPILGVALTMRAGSPLCGVPFHAVDAYLAKAIRAGMKVAICDQVEDPALAKGVVKREITRIITPGTVTEDSILDAGANNYIAAVVMPVRANGAWGLAMLDLSTGDFFVEEFLREVQIADALRRYAPSECVVGREANDTTVMIELLAEGMVKAVTTVEDWTFQPEAAAQELTRHFQVHSLEGFGLGDAPHLIAAAGALLKYVQTDLLRAVGHIHSIHRNATDEFLAIDETTCLNLDLIPMRSHPRENTLLGVLDSTLTPMGARAMRASLLRPSGKLSIIQARHDAVGWFAANRILLSDFRTALRDVRDLERLISRVESGLGGGRELRGLALSLAAIPNLFVPLGGCSVPLVRELLSRISLMPDLKELLLASIDENPPVSLREGGFIRMGYDAELDELRRLSTSGLQWLAEYQTEQQEKTGIKTLKVRHNKVFGFYIEISKSAAQAAMDSGKLEGYQRRQTLVNAERFITSELKEYEEKVLGAQEKSYKREYELFCEIRTKVIERTIEIQQSAAAIAELDVLGAFGERALALDYTRPEMHEGDELRISGGRHPVVEQMADAERFIPNDTFLDCNENQIAILTGPNMAGKSTYIRQVAMIAVMAHAGSFIPAAAARIPVMDRVFTRVGAGDDLARGRSTFMVEMQETANILNNATARSLIVLDEIGRGTSTFDGISIAWAVAEYLHNTPTIKAKTLFATHYHELTDLEIQLKGVKNYSVQVKEQGESIVFLRTIARGAADKSYGIQVARLAGLPTPVVSRAHEILGNLEEGELDVTAQPKLAKRSRKKIDYDKESGQLQLFELE